MWMNKSTVIWENLLYPERDMRAFCFYSSHWELKIELEWEGFYKNQVSSLGCSDATDLSHLQNTSI